MEEKVIALLLDCLHEHDGAGRETAERLSSLTLDEWQRIRILAGEQQVCGLLYHRLKSRGLEPLIPDGILHALRRSHHAIALDNLRFYAELRRIASALHARQVPVLALKGVYIATALYENLASREMRDMDLLVSAAHLGQAAKTVESLGYKPMDAYTVEASIATNQHLPRFIKPQVAAIELHWNITSPNCNYSIDPLELWERVAPASIAGVNLLALSPEDLLLHLCAHATYQHLFELGLRPSCDIAETIRHFGESLAWRDVVERARRWHWERGVYVALRLAKELVGAAVPDAVLRDLRPAAFDETMLNIARTHMLTNRSLGNTVAPFLARLWHTQGLTARLRMFLRRVFLARAELSAIYGITANSRKIYFYYLVRLKDVLCRHGRITLGLLRGDPVLTSIVERKAALQHWLMEE